MKKILLSLVVSTGLLFSMTPEEQKIKTSVENLQIIKQAQLKILKVQDFSGMIMGQAQDPNGNILELFVPNDLTKVIIGKAVDARTGAPINFPKDMSILEGKEAFTYGNGPKEVYVFTDPECPMCKKFELKMEGLKDKYTFKMYYFPLSYHKEAVAMTKFVEAGKNGEEKFKRLVDIAKGSKDYRAFTPTQEESTKTQNLINEHMGYGRTLGLQGTPSVWDVNGNDVKWWEE